MLRQIPTHFVLFEVDFGFRGVRKREVHALSRKCQARRRRLCACVCVVHRVLRLRRDLISQWLRPHRFKQHSARSTSTGEICDQEAMFQREVVG